MALVFSVLNKHTAFIVLHTNFYFTFIKLPSMRIIWHSKRTSAILETSCRLLNELAWPLFYQLISSCKKILKFTETKLGNILEAVARVRATHVEVVAIPPFSVPRV